jgi:hypothetical protein
MCVDEADSLRNQAIKYLEEPVHPTIRQTEESVVKFLDKLETDPQYTQLTKSERLQLVNSAPTSLVELHVVSRASLENSIYLDAFLDSPPS